MTDRCHGHKQRIGETQIARVPGLLGDRLEGSENALIADGVLARSQDDANIILRLPAEPAARHAASAAISANDHT